MDIGVLLALAAAVAYGASDFVGGVGSRRYSPWQIVFVGQSAGACAMLVAGLAVPGAPVAADFAWAVVAGAGSVTGGLFLFRGLVRGRMGLVAPISAVGAAMVPLLAGVAFGERPGWLGWAGMLAALPGIWLVSRNSETQPIPDSRGALADGALAGAGFGTLFIALAQISDGAGLLPLAVNQTVGAALTIIFAASLGQIWRPSPRVVGWGSSSGVLGALGTLSFLVATGTTSLGLAAVLASLYPAVTVLLAAGVLRERVSPGQRVGIGVCTVAVAAMALG
ncbi:drug/metabolite transporter (DMT)-like permease [Okibacterium sp. HSC-33S16]|uniref:EamA family transporter n=1 Tax=Okibacterium sp. HSC-33S16 TaxID=2910965 RepID=UPI0020A1D39E|nr:EamA family transporter [Okibacterium sp. HSC-33S16]MCP2031973.1 drug/metabolite transporter (DMT)-like permease [Okibacterium sp. HSC-33S16]